MRWYQASVFHYLPEPLQALAEWRRILRPGGRLVLIDWCRDFATIRALDFVLRRFDRAHGRAWGVAELREALGGTGDAARSGALGADILALGESVYAANCATCHGERGQGQPNWQSRGPDGVLPAPPHDASGHTWHHPDAVLMEIITVGGQATYGGSGIVSGMPAFGGLLSNEEVAAVLGYIKSLWGDDEREYQASLR